MSQVPISALPSLATPLNPALQFEVAQGTTTSSKVTLTQILTDPIITGSPTISNFTLAIHDHSNNVNGGQLTNTALIQGVFSAITGLGTQTTAINMGINNILQSGFLELREITKPSDPEETAGRLYTRDVANNTILFFLNNLGVETDLLDIGTGTFLPLAGGTMDDAAAIAFTNTGAGDDPTISVTPSDKQTLTISDNLLVPKIIFLGDAGWNMDINDADTDFVIKSPEGDGSHNFDIISDNGEISLQNTTLGSDFTAKFFVEQFSALATTQAIALTIEAQIVDGTDEGSNPVIAINALQAVANIDTRPIFGILNNGTNLWEISKDGDVTQEGDLIMGQVNGITFDDWRIQHSIGGSTLKFTITDGGDGSILFQTDNFRYNFGLKETRLLTTVEQLNDETVSTIVTFETDIIIRDFNDLAGSDPLGKFRFRTESGNVNQRPLFQFQNFNTTKWLLDLDGTVTQFGDLIMGSKEIQFTDDKTFIHEDTGFLELHVDTGRQIRMVIGTGEDFTYQFGPNNLNFGGRGIASMGQLQFGVGVNVTIQRGTANTNSLELDANTGGEIVLRVSNDEEYNFGATEADWNNNSLINVGILKLQNIIEAGAQLISIFTTTFAEFDTRILTMDFKGVNDLLQTVTYAQILPTQRDPSNGNEKGSIQFRVATGGISPTILFTIDGVGDGTNPQLLAFAELDMDDNNIINVGILEFSNTNNRLTDSGGGSELKIQGEEKIQLAIQSAPTALFSFTDNTIDWDSEIGTIPIFTVARTESVVTTEKDIFQFIFNGQDNELASLTFAEIVVRQTERTPDEEDGSIAFNIIQDGSLLPLMILNGEDGNVDLKKEIGLSFRNTADDGTLLLETNTSDNLLFDTRIVKTETQSKFEVKTDGAQNITGTQTIVTGLTLVLANRIQGQGLITLFLLVDAGANNQDATFEIINSTGDIFEKVVGIGNTSDSNNPITLTIPTDLDGGTITVRAQATSGSFNINVGSYLTVFEVF